MTLKYEDLPPVESTPLPFSVRALHALLGTVMGLSAGMIAFGITSGVEMIAVRAFEMSDQMLGIADRWPATQATALFRWFEWIVAVGAGLGAAVIYGFGSIEKRLDDAKMTRYATTYRDVIEQHIRDEAARRAT